MTIAIIVLAQLTTSPTPPSPKWVETVIPHWSCPPDWDFNHETVACYKRSARVVFAAHDPKTQEEVYWGWSKIVPSNGVLKISYPPEFLGRPGCSVVDKTDEHTPLCFTDESKEGFTIHTAPGHKLYLNCRGVIAR